MNKYLYVLRASFFHFKRGIEVLWEGLLNPEKFQKEDMKQNELLVKLFPTIVAMSVINMDRCEPKHCISTFHHS
jgi:hypothetical protein